jgi:putative ABC transport system permease protein
VTIGIFCIVAILTATSSLEKNLRSSIDELGDRIVYVQKWPWIFGGDYKWWEYIGRPEPEEKEFRRIMADANPEIIDQTAFFFEFRSNKLKSKLEEIENVHAYGVSGRFFEISKMNIELGRIFTPMELDKGKNVCVIGYTLALNLFHGANPIGRTIDFNGIKTTIIGLMAKTGNSLGQPNYDEQIILPALFSQRFAKPNSSGVNSSIVIKGRDEVDLSLLDFEITRIMRSVRKLSPKDKDDFAINKLTMFSDGLNQTFGILNAVAWLIGGFSLLVGGFGIANIMFVSVKERTSIIGLQKALGAKKMFIISQFIVEAILLCIVGALIGIVMVFILSIIANTQTEFTFYMSVKVISMGISVAVFIGMIAGISPALSAANLDPVVALRK